MTEQIPDLVSYVCLTCQKSFEHHLVTGSTEMKCPECGGVSYNVGRKFKAPRKGDKEQWDKVRLLITSGFRFQPSQEEPRDMPYPESLADAKKFVAKPERKTVKLKRS